MNRTIKDATVKCFYHESHDQFRQLADFVAAYKFAQRLKTLKGLALYEFVYAARVSQATGLLSTRSTKCRGLNI